MRSDRTRRNWRIWGTILAIVLGAAALTAAYFGLIRANPSTAGVSPSSSAPAAGPSESAVPSPANPSASAGASAAVSPSATDPSASSAPSPSAGTGKRVATVQVVDITADGSGITVSGYVSNTIEDGGTCTATATNGDVTVAQKQQGLADAQSTSCGQITIPRSDLTPGTWTVALEYSSPRYQGTSAKGSVNVR